MSLILLAHVDYGLMCIVGCHYSLTKNVKQSTNSNIKKLLLAMHKIFDKSLSRPADYEKVALAVGNDY